MSAKARQVGPWAEAVAEELRVELARRGWTQRRLSEASGVPASTLHKRLSAKRPVDVEELGRIARGLGLTVSEVLRRAEQHVGPRGCV